MMASSSSLTPRNRITPLNDKKSATKTVYSGQAGSARERNCQLLKLTALTVIPGLILIGRCIVSLVQDTEALSSNSYILDQVKISVDLGKIIHVCQQERGTTALYVSSARDPFVKKLLDEKYEKTDISIKSLKEWVPIQSPTHFQSREMFHDEIRNFRDNLNIKNETLRNVIQFYSDNNQVFISLIGENLNPGRPISFWKDLVGYKMLILSKEQAGVERALGSTFYARGQFPSNDLLWYRDKSTMGEYYLKQAQSYSTYVRSLVDSYFKDSDLVKGLEAMKEEINENKYSPPSVFQGAVWFDNMTEYIDILNIIQDSLASRISEIAANEISNLRSLLISSAIQVIVAVTIVPIVTILNRNIVQKIQIYAADLAFRTFELEEEKKRTEMLFFKLLPKSVASKLIDRCQVVPEIFKSATIMFLDVADFAIISGNCKPDEAIGLLNNVYSIVDEHLVEYDVYRVENIGGGNMITSGVPRRNGVKHVEEIARLSIQLVSTISIQETPGTTEHLALRIGFNTGPCTAGIVGNRMPRYCVFGDTVNVANIMESTGQPGKIQISERCARILQTYQRYKIIERGQIQVKENCQMTTYWLEGFEDGITLRID